MELSHDALVGFRTRFSTIFNSALNAAAPMIEQVALRVDSGRVELVNHRWMKGIPGVREFLGNRVYNNLDNAGFTVKNRKWEDTVAILREDLERDAYGIYDPFVSRMGQAVMLHRDKLGFPLLSAALAAATRANYTAYDTQAFFGAHTAGRETSGVNASNFTNVTNAPVSEAALKIAFASLQNRKDDKGNILEAAMSRPRVMCKAGATYWTLAALANNQFIVGTQPGSGKSSATSQAGQTENVLKGTFDLLPPCPYLATDTEWYAFPSDPIFRPLVFQVEEEIQFLGFEKFLHRWSENDEFVVGTRALYNVALGLPEMVFASTGDA